MAEIDLSPDEQANIDRLYDLAENASFYDLLGVRSDAEKKDIQAAFYELSRRWHPDRFFRRQVGDYEERIEAVFVAITEAWRTLGNDEARSRYDVEKRDLILKKTTTSPGRPASPAAPAATSGERTGRPTPMAGQRPPARPDPRQAKVREEIRKQVIERIRKARTYHREAVEHFEAGRVMKASSSIALARTFDPKNADYAALAEQYQLEARKLQAKAFIAAAESAESFANLREALANYRKAVDYGTDHARAHYRLGVLIRRVEEDRREALKHMRSAIKLDPDNLEFRMGLGELYAELGLQVNARAQFERILKVDRGNVEAREALKNLK